MFSPSFTVVEYESDFLIQFGTATKWELLLGVVRVPSYDETGKPGAERFPSRPIVSGLAVRYLSEDKPGVGLSNSNYGLRGSWLAKGWDLSAFYYRCDWMLRPKVTWNFEKNWRWGLGADAFSGPATGFFGRHNAQDRVYSEFRRSF